MHGKLDYHVALVFVIASAAASYLYDAGLILFVGAIVNLVHQRSVLYRAGEEFARRTRETIAEDWAQIEARVAKAEADCKSVKDAQNTMQTAIRGHMRQP